ncbi:hypothetical protein Fcan01_02114 [Folsomia candida]|uniref:Uncharacterized protein n=1 Tax=Folsomia candida TaxID=158441 RepID=A0A226EVM1_FOLCA|nr:hypothetical protein Fcan01_02114 [Folsomia candida]
MDKIKKKRTAVRRRVTKLLQDLENELAKEEASLEKLTCHKETLDDLKVTIGALDNEYLDSMIAGEHDEELVNAETDCAAEYEDKIKLGMVKIRGKVKCFICEKLHHQVMCSHKQSKEEEAVTDGVKTMTNIQPTVAMKTSTNEDKVVLRGTMRVKVSGNKNQYREARLLIDSGSDISYIREEFAEELHLTPIGKKVFTTEVFGGGYDVCERKQYNVKLEGLPAGKNMLKKTEEVPLFSARTICGDCAPIPVGPWIKDLLKLNVVLTDTYVDSHNIDILIGSNLIGRLVTGKMVKLNTSVIATETTIGWYLNEELPKQESQTLAARSIVMCTRTKELSALWDLDTLGISDTIQKATQDEHEAKVKEEFQKNLERDRDGRYVVKLPWLTESMRIPDNRNVAMKRLESTSTRVVTKEDLNVTKRTVLSIASQVFDPIGFTSPTVLQLKIMLQEAWAQDLKWDELWGTEAINKVKTCTKFASYQKNLRVLAYILRFVGKGAVKKPYPKFVTLPELRFAERWIPISDAATCKMSISSGAHQRDASISRARRSAVYGWKTQGEILDPTS